MNKPLQVTVPEVGVGGEGGWSWEAEPLVECTQYHGHALPFEPWWNRKAGEAVVWSQPPPPFE